VLASFVTSNARLAARQFNMPDIAQKIADLKQRKAPGDVVDEAERLRDYIENPEEPFQALKGWMFAWFLGGSISSALLNATQPFMVTLPYLSQFGATQAAAELTKAMKGGASGKVTDADLQKALLRAAEDGKVDPQQVHHLFHEGMESRQELRGGDRRQRELRYRCTKTSSGVKSASFRKSLPWK